VWEVGVEWSGWSGSWWWAGGGGAEVKVVL
jgi:hypothetical protein